MKAWKKLRTRKAHRTMRRAIVFLARFSLLSVPLYALLAFGVDLSPLQDFVAGNVMSLASAFGVPAVREGYDIIINFGTGTLTASVSPDCTGWKTMLAYAALVLAVPRVPLRRRLWGLAGVAVVYIANIARIFAIVVTGSRYGPDALNVLHSVTWSVAFPLFVLFLWFAWFSGLKKEHLYQKGENTFR